MRALHEYEFYFLGKLEGSPEDKLPIKSSGGYSITGRNKAGNQYNKMFTNTVYLARETIAAY